MHGLDGPDFAKPLQCSKGVALPEREAKVVDRRFVYQSTRYIGEVKANFSNERYLYSMNAQEVIIWLGLPDNTTADAFKLIRYAAHCAHAEASDHNDLVDEVYNEAKNIERGFPARDRGEGDGLWPLRLLLSEPWFSRVWIIQEIVTARSAVMISGALRLSFSEFCAAITFFQKKGYSLSLSIATC